MKPIETRQVRRARERAQATTAKVGTMNPRGNRAARRAERRDDNEIIIRPTTLNAAQSCRRASRDYRIRHKLRPARGMVHPRVISERRFFAMRFVAYIFAVAAKRAELRRAA